jgi:hypothetical protein
MSKKMHFTQIDLNRTRPLVHIDEKFFNKSCLGTGDLLVWESHVCIVERVTANDDNKHVLVCGKLFTDEIPDNISDLPSCTKPILDEFWNVSGIVKQAPKSPPPYISW